MRTLVKALGIVLVTICCAVAGNLSKRPQIYQTANATTLVNPYRYAVSGPSETTVEDRTLTGCILSSSIDVQLPSTVNSGDLLIMVVGFNSDGSANTTTGPSGWAEHYNDHLTPWGGEIGIWSKVADGTEDGNTETVSATNGTSAIAQVYRIVAYTGTATTAINTSTKKAAVATSVSFNSLSPSWGTTTLWMIIGGWINDDESVTAWPTNYATNGSSPSCGLGANQHIRLGISYRSNSASSESPGNISLSESAGTAGFVLAVQP